MISSTCILDTAVRAHALFAKHGSKPRPDWKMSESPNGRHLDGHAEGLAPETRLVLVGSDHFKKDGDPKDTLVIPENFVFRHYTTAKGLEQILATQTLVPGPRAFSFFSHPFIHLLGAFLTVARFPHDQVGVLHGTHYADICLWAGTGLLRLTDDEQYWMIPGEIQHSDSWLKAYQRWVEWGMPDEAAVNRMALERDYSPEVMALYGMTERFRRIYDSGGLREPSKIPVKILSSGQI